MSLAGVDLTPKLRKSLRDAKEAADDGLIDDQEYKAWKNQAFADNIACRC